ncbi:UNVERIFIED_CONTAM: Retrovirus-related Pol polyprotein from transposon TNT 1-94 [Sesamum calycinum]|uniref:Retrovirus-related Pol polyprotein from transposon TNT 1-94 n=1 Tax=Sesamum calycinum TaxID=2727403 RepID=A0AAW2J2U3_9LAMI
MRQNILGISLDKNGIGYLPQDYFYVNRKSGSWRISLVDPTLLTRKKQYDMLNDVTSILQRMKEVYAIPDRHTRYVATKEFFRAKMTERSSVQEHWVKMLSLVEKLKDLKAGLDNDTYINMILQSLPPSDDPFIVNFNMNGLEKSIREASTSKVKDKRTRRWKRKKGKAKAKTVSAPIAPVEMGKGKRKIDICGPLNTQAKGGFSYFITFTDDHSRYGYVYLMRYKSEAFVRSVRVPQPPERYGFLGVTGQLDNDPKTYGEAMSGKWLEAIKSKIDSMSSNQVWTLMDRPKGVKPIGCKVHFEETFSSIAMAKSIQIMLAIAACDLYGSAGGIHDSRRRVEGLPSAKIHIWLKAASRSWNICFDEVIWGYDLVKNDFDLCVYKKVSGSSIVFLVLYVDNILLIENDIKILGDTKAWLSTQLSMKDLGEASYILRIKISRDRSKRILGMTQNPYVEKVLERFKMEHSKRGFPSNETWG